MPVNQKGTFGVAWSLATGISATGLGTCQPQSVDYGVESDEKAIKGAGGATKCLIFSDHRETISIDVVPSSTTAALANAQSILPISGADVTITDADDPEIVGAPGTSNRWHFISGTKRKTVEGEVHLTMQLKRFETDLPPIS